MYLAAVDGIEYSHSNRKFDDVVEREPWPPFKEAAFWPSDTQMPIRPLARAPRIVSCVFKQIVFKDAAEAKPGVRFNQMNSKTEDNLRRTMRVTGFSVLVEGVLCDLVGRGSRKTKMFHRRKSTYTNDLMWLGL